MNYGHHPSPTLPEHQGCAQRHLLLQATARLQRAKVGLISFHLLLRPYTATRYFASSTFYSAIRLSESFGTVGGGRDLNWGPKARLRFGLGLSFVSVNS